MDIATSSQGPEALSHGSLLSCVIALIAAALLAFLLYLTTYKPPARIHIDEGVARRSVDGDYPEISRQAEEASAPPSPFAHPPSPILLQLQLEEQASSHGGETGSPGPSPSSARDTLPDLPTFPRRSSRDQPHHNVLPSISSAPELRQLDHYDLTPMHTPVIEEPSTRLEEDEDPVAALPAIKSQKVFDDIQIPSRIDSESSTHAPTTTTTGSFLGITPR